MSFFGDLDRQINGMFSTEGMAGNNYLATDIIDYQDRYEVTCNAPGLTKEDVKIEMDNEILTIVATVKPLEFQEGAVYLMPLHERFVGTLKRAYRLKFVDATKIVAKMQDGVLRLTLPKLQAQAPNSIEIM
jgi:HSP20 family protein